MRGDEKTLEIQVNKWEKEWTQLKKLKIQTEIQKRNKK